MREGARPEHKPKLPPSDMFLVRTLVSTPKKNPITIGSDLQMRSPLFLALMKGLDGDDTIVRALGAVQLKMATEYFLTYGVTLYCLRGGAAAADTAASPACVLAF